MLQFYGSRKFSRVNSDSFILTVEAYQMDLFLRIAFFEIGPVEKPKIL